ncbi:hypothetical protein GCM10028857_26100 [Salinarchaeum chitinilyticum]
MPTEEDLAHHRSSRKQLRRMMVMFGREVPEDQPEAPEIDEEALAAEVEDLEQELQDEL